MSTLDETARLVMDVLDEFGIPNALCGGLAHNVWSPAGGRFITDDVDVAVLAQTPADFDTAPFVEKLRQVSGSPWFFRDRYRRVDRMIYKFQLGEGATATHFDLVLPEHEYAKKAIEAAAAIEIDAKEKRVLQPEDVILFKSLGRRDKDREKIAKLHELIELDLDYIEAWAKHLGRWDYVQEALRWAEDETRDLIEDEE